MKNEPRRPCPACYLTDTRFCGQKNGFDLLVCLACKSIYTSQIPDVDEAENYDEYYSPANLEVPTFIKERVREIIAGFSRYRSNNRLLDIGFGAGTILDEAKTQNWEAYGTEVSRPAFESAQNRGLNVFHGFLSSATYPDDHFDVVTASEILEHLPEPEAELREILRILRPGGLLWATTPSARSLSFRLLGQKWSVLSPPEHTQLYSRKGAELMLRRAGFDKIEMMTYGLNPAEIIHHYKRRSSDDPNFNRVSTSYDLNMKMTGSPLRKGIKSILNGTLNLVKAGDSLKIFAHKGGRSNAR